MCMAIVNWSFLTVPFSLINEAGENASFSFKGYFSHPVSVNSSCNTTCRGSVDFFV